MLFTFHSFGRILGNAYFNEMELIEVYFFLERNMFISSEEMKCGWRVFPFLSIPRRHGSFYLSGTIHARLVLVTGTREFYWVSPCDRASVTRHDPPEHNMNSAERGMILWNCRFQDEAFKQKREKEVRFPRIPCYTPQTGSSGGCGAPRRTPSGHLIPELRGHTDIRYHQKNTMALENNVRGGREAIERYRADLDSQVAEKRKRRESQDIIGSELVSTMRKHSRSLPKLNYLGSTDVTRAAVANVSPRAADNGDSYRESLWAQRTEKAAKVEATKIDERLKILEHFATWEKYWGRPGNGAPRELFKKEKLFRLIHQTHLQPRQERNS